MFPLGKGSEGIAVTPDGLTVVGISESANGPEAFRWTSSTGMVGLGDIPGGDFYSIGMGVSSNGNIVVGSSEFALQDELEAFRWTSGTGLTGLGFFGPYTRSQANSVSADGSTIVGLSSALGVGTEATVWDGSGVRGLGYLPGALRRFLQAVQKGCLRMDSSLLVAAIQRREPRRSFGPAERGWSGLVICQVVPRLVLQGRFLWMGSMLSVKVNRTMASKHFVTPCQQAR